LIPVVGRVAEVGVGGVGVVEFGLVVIARIVAQVRAGPQVLGAKFTRGGGDSPRAGSEAGVGRLALGLPRLGRIKVQAQVPLSAVAIACGLGVATVVGRGAGKGGEGGVRLGEGGVRLREGEVGPVGDIGVGEGRDLQPLPQGVRSHQRSRCEAQTGRLEVKFHVSLGRGCGEESAELVVEVFHQ